MMTKENITALTAATSGYKFQIALETALNKKQLDALDYEPLLVEMATNNTIEGQAINLPLFEIASMVNMHFGNLCYRAYYKEEGITKTNIEYAVLWGELVTKLAERAETATDYCVLGSCVQMQFAPFEDRVECEQFANENYYYAIEAMDSVYKLVNLVGGHLTEEYYENEELVTKAGEKALAIATTFEDYTTICYDENWNAPFFDTPIYKTAAAKAIALKDQASEDEISNFKSCLQEWDDQETLNAL